VLVVLAARAARRGRGGIGGCVVVLSFVCVGRNVRREGHEERRMEMSRVVAGGHAKEDKVTVCQWGVDDVWGKGDIDEN